MVGASRTTGTTTPAEIQRHAQKHGYHLDIFYTNVKGEAINHIYQAVDEGADGLVIVRQDLPTPGLRTEGLYQGFSVHMRAESAAKERLGNQCVVPRIQGLVQNGGVSAS